MPRGDDCLRWTVESSTGTEMIRGVHSFSAMQRVFQANRIVTIDERD